jgi:hypothetical protein
VLLGIMLLASSCSRSRNDEPAAGDAPAVEDPVPGSRPVAEVSPAADDRPVDDQPAAIESSDFLAYRPARRLLPDDAMIGPLADDLDATASERAAVRTVDRLLGAVRSGDLHDLPLSATGQVHVAATVEYHLRRGVTLAGFRLGRVERTGDTAFLRARLSGPLGSIPAEVYLVLESDRWFVDDLQADWAALQRTQPAPDPIPLPRPAGWSHF